MDTIQLSLILLPLLGLLISAYALTIKRKMNADKNYRPLCDISSMISCTKAIGSGYGSMFLVPNSIFGILFYGIVLALAVLGLVQWVFWLSAASVLGSIYLAYLSFYKLRIICPLCTAAYLINIGLLVFSSQKFF